MSGNVVDMSPCPHGCGQIIANHQHFVAHTRRCYKKVEWYDVMVQWFNLIEESDSIDCLFSFQMCFSSNFHKVININLRGDRAICVSHITRYPSDTQVRHIDDVLARKVYVMHLLFFIEKHFWTDIRLIYFSMKCQKRVPKWMWFI